MFRACRIAVRSGPPSRWRLACAIVALAIAAVHCRRPWPRDADARSRRSRWKPLPSASTRVLTTATPIASPQPTCKKREQPKPATAREELATRGGRLLNAVERRCRKARTEAPPSAASTLQLPGGLGGPENGPAPRGLRRPCESLALLTVVSLAPAVLMMTTCFVRIVIVLGLLRQSLGTQQLPSNQVVTSLALFMTLLIMAPVWNRVYDDAVLPYTSHEITLEEAWDAGVKPVRGFMSAQIERTGNSDDVWLFYKYLPADTPAAVELRRRAADGAAAGVHAQRIEDGVPDRLSDLSAVSGHRPGRGQRDDLDGHVHVAAGVRFAAVEAAVVRAGRRLAPGRRHADG